MLRTLFNFTNRKQGGIRFIKLGCITLSVSVTSKSAYAAKQHALASKALAAAADKLEWSLGGWTVEGYARYMDAMTLKALDDVWLDVYSDRNLAWS